MEKLKKRASILFLALKNITVAAVYSEFPS